jgi:hypothetical protein
MEDQMRLAALTLAGLLGLAAGMANAAPAVPNFGLQQSSNIVQVWGGCGPGFRPVPGHWSRWRGGWVPPHCVRNWRGADGGWRGYYGGGYPYWHRYGYRYGY